MLSLFYLYLIKGDLPMESLELKEEIYIIKRLKEDLDFYKQGLREIIISLYTRRDIIEKFKGLDDEIMYKYLRVGEILNDITENYIDYESFTSNSGEIIDFRKIYTLKAEEKILTDEKLLIELEEDDDIEESYIKNIEDELYRYRNINIFDEFNIIEELLLQIRECENYFNNEINIFLNNLLKFNKLEELDKYKNLNDFCYENLENNKLIKKLINLYNEWHGAEIVKNITEFEAIPFFDRWDSEKLKILLNWNSEIYFKITKTLNTFKQLSEYLLNIKYVEKQIKLIDELKEVLTRYY